jgi:hypothetical protein
VLDSIEPSAIDSTGLANWGGFASCDGCTIADNLVLHADVGLRIRGDAAAYPSSTTVTHDVFYDVAENRFDAADVLVDATNDLGAAVLPIRAAGDRPAPYYELADASEAVDFGDNAVCPWTPEDGDGDGVAVCDAGAYER